MNIEQKERKRVPSRSGEAPSELADVPPSSGKDELAPEGHSPTHQQLLVKYCWRKSGIITWFPEASACFYLDPNMSLADAVKYALANLPESLDGADWSNAIVRTSQGNIPRCNWDVSIRTAFPPVESESFSLCESLFGNHPILYIWSDAKWGADQPLEVLKLLGGAIVLLSAICISFHYADRLLTTR